MTIVERYRKIQQAAERVRELKLQNLYAFIDRTSHLTHLPAHGQADILSHNWYTCASDDRKARMSPATRSAYRYIRREFDRIWESSRIVDRFHARVLRPMSPRDLSAVYISA